ncbi:MAG: hypothetical protein WKF58_09360 [Ilumatobacteraceae bacterium]
MRAPLGVALVAGLAVAFSLPPWGWWPLSIVGCALYVAAQDGHQRFRRGFVFGAAWTYVGMAWMWQLTIPGFLFAGVFFGGLPRCRGPSWRRRVAGDSPGSRSRTRSWRRSGSRSPSVASRSHRSASPRSPDRSPPSPAWAVSSP